MQTNTAYLFTTFTFLPLIRVWLGRISNEPQIQLASDCKHLLERKETNGAVSFNRHISLGNHSFHQIFKDGKECKMFFQIENSQLCKLRWEGSESLKMAKWNLFKSEVSTSEIGFRTGNLLHLHSDAIVKWWWQVIFRRRLQSRILMPFPLLSGSIGRLPMDFKLSTSWRPKFEEKKNSAVFEENFLLRRKFLVREKLCPEKFSTHKTFKAV